jgi:hypothetical protein
MNLNYIFVDRACFLGVERRKRKETVRTVTRCASCRTTGLTRSTVLSTSQPHIDVHTLQ